MMIKLKCLVCGYIFEVSEYELRTFPDYYDKCFLCNGQLRVENLEEIVKYDIDKQIKEYLDKWFNELGVEGTIELIERHKDQPSYRLYKAELERRGFKLKE